MPIHTKRTNSLTANQKHRLAIWLQANWEAIEKLKPTKDQVADEAGKKLGFKITASNIGYAQSMAIPDAPWPRSVGGTTKGTQEALKTITAQMNALLIDLGKPPLNTFSQLHNKMFPPNGELPTE